MKRMVGQQGPNTLGISLPSRWIQSNSIKKGDEIDIEEIDGGLFLGSKKESLSEATIRIPHYDAPPSVDKKSERYIIRTIIINAMRKGYQKIKLLYDSPKVLTIINSCADEVIGYEITSQNSHECIIENVVSLLDNNLEKSFVKLRQIVMTLLELTHQELIHDEDAFDEIESTFRSLERNYNTFCRFLMCSCHERTKEKIMLYTCAAHIYESGRNMFYTVQLKRENNIFMTLESKKFAKEVFIYVRSVMEFIATKDLQKVALLNTNKNRLMHYEINKLISHNKKDNIVLLQLTFIVRRMWDSIGPYIGNII